MTLAIVAHIGIAGECIEPLVQPVPLFQISRQVPGREERLPGPWRVGRRIRIGLKERRRKPLGDQHVSGDLRSADQRLGLTLVSLLAATAFALADWLDGTVRRPPPRSQLMVTGGFKGRVHKLDGDQLLSIAAERLGVRVITEYGMTELSSQLWGRAGGPFKPPPWLRPTAVDPVTGAPVPRGKAGQLRFLDLCNVDSAVHIETLDQGIVHDDGAVTLFGRLPGAPARGCSLTVEDAWMAR